MKLKVMVVDDERPARQRIEDLLFKDEDFEIVSSLGDSAEATQQLLKEPPDLALLDIQMPGSTGFDIVRRVGSENMPTTIFVTAYDRFALSAFELCAMDYLLKPFEDRRFFEAMERAKRQIRLLRMEKIQRPLGKLLKLLEDDGGPQKEYTSYLTRIPVKTRNQVTLVAVETISHLSAQGAYCQIHTAEKTHLIRRRMHHLEQQLDPKSFFRIHRSTIVNLNFVKSLVPFFRDDYLVLLMDGTQLRLSRGRRADLQRCLGMDF